MVFAMYVGHHECEHGKSCSGKRRKAFSITHLRLAAAYVDTLSGFNTGTIVEFLNYRNMRVNMEA